MRLLLLTCALSVLSAGCGTVPKSEADRAALKLEIQGAIGKFKEKDPTLSSWFDEAKGYAIFPHIGKAGVGVGGSFGRGLVYKDGEQIGYIKVTEASIGLQLGGQAFAQLIFFEKEASLERFISGKFEFGAQASAVAATAGAATKSNYENGVAVFTMVSGGLMYEATIGGQKFKYTPNEEVEGGAGCGCGQ
ncbi:MAG: lipid-binding SYLF domain-containing protein [Planctomycetota bacterium]